jgi:hypothetical protein
MNIELKNIYWKLPWQDTTDPFLADLYIDNKLAGIAQGGYNWSNDINYVAAGKTGERLIRAAENFCGKLPIREFLENGKLVPYKMDLRQQIEILAHEAVMNPEIGAHFYRVANLEQTNIVVGIPGISLGCPYGLREPISEIMKTPRHYEELVMLLNSLKEDLKDGVVILNRNIPEQFLRAAQLSKDQYTPPYYDLLAEIMQSTNRSR